MRGRHSVSVATLRAFNRLICRAMICPGPVRALACALAFVLDCSEQTAEDRRCANPTFCRVCKTVSELVRTSVDKG